MQMKQLATIIAGPSGLAVETMGNCEPHILDNPLAANFRARPLHRNHASQLYLLLKWLRGAG